SERIPAAAGIVNLRYKSCPEMAGQDQKVVLCHWYDVTGDSYTAEDLTGNMPHDAFKFLQYRLDNIEQAEAFIKYRNRNYQSRENSDWPEPPEGVKRYVIRARS
ncbi:hypothetical protein VBL68_23675, partial [Enterobacter hormaechei]|nr:hypothetical protein [Escherichia coli]MEA3617326.1 hypothetical protein [Enterobacter hormaechei]MEA3707930.1 hypothetical protein [Enterobacter hormaechei]MEA3721550.1 hypothetical protein [Enterobacter hormaechei]